MRRLALITMAAIAVALLAMEAPQPGQQAPDFTATDSNGHTQKLSDYHGKFVVLEWTNSGCPFTKKHYDSGNMQKLQKEWTSKGVVWMTVLSSAQGKQGYKTAAEENAYVKQVGASPSAVLLDADGQLGHLYGAKTAPHIFVIAPSGKLIYDGAIDNKPTTDQEDIANADNYVSDALTAAMSGQQIVKASTQPYGCSVKYQ
jgi:peroxiredoxin